MARTNSEIMEAVLKKLPHPEQIHSIDFSLERQIRFEWRGYTLRVGDNLSVEEVEGNVLGSTAFCMVLSKLLKS